MKMKSEIKVYFRIVGFPMSPEVLTDKLGLKPTDTWKKGDAGRIAKTTFKNNGWELSSGLNKSVDLKTHVGTLLDNITPFKKNFVKVCSEYPPDLICVVYSYGGDRPAIVFERDIIKELTELNASIDVDLYVL